MFKLALRSWPALCMASWSVVAGPTVMPQAPTLDAKGYVLMDYHTGHIIAEHNANQRLSPASLTKVMTSYVIGQEIKQGNISEDDDVTISDNAWAKRFPGSSKMFIEVGTKVKVADLNRGIVIQSGNDATVAMAEHISGSADGFVDLMNAWAQKLNMLDSHFVNPHGLDAPELYSTPADMARLSQALIRDLPEEFALYKEKSFSYNGITQYNRNRLLWDESLNVDGLKTGHTNQAGYSLISTATQDEMRLIAVVMGTETPAAREAESKKLLTYGFRFFDTVTIHNAGDTLITDRVWMGTQPEIRLGLQQTTTLTLPKSHLQQLEASIQVNEALTAPIRQGDVVGEVIYHINEEDVASYPLVALEDVDQGSWFSRLKDSLQRLLQRWFG